LRVVTRVGGRRLVLRGFVGLASVAFGLWVLLRGLVPTVAGRLGRGRLLLGLATVGGGVLGRRAFERFGPIILDGRLGGATRRVGGRLLPHLLDRLVRVRVSPGRVGGACLE